MTKCETHKYKRIVLSRNKNAVYKCVNCPSYVIEALVIGRDCLCWYCGSTFKMSQKSLLLKPHCGCRSEIIGNKNLLSKKRISAPDKDYQSAKQSVMDNLLAKLGK